MFRGGSESMHASDCHMDLKWDEENVQEHYHQKEMRIDFLGPEMAF